MISHRISPPQWPEAKAFLTLPEKWRCVLRLGLHKTWRKGGELVLPGMRGKLIDSTGLDRTGSQLEPQCILTFAAVYLIYFLGGLVGQEHLPRGYSGTSVSSFRGQAVWGKTDHGTRRSRCHFLRVYLRNYCDFLPTRCLQNQLWLSFFFFGGGGSFWRKLLSLFRDYL